MAYSVRKCPVLFSVNERQEYQIMSGTGALLPSDQPHCFGKESKHPGKHYPEILAYPYQENNLNDERDREKQPVFANRLGIIHFRKFLQI